MQIPSKVTWMLTQKKGVNEIMEGIVEKKLKTADFISYWVVITEYCNVYILSSLLQQIGFINTPTL